MTEYSNIPEDLRWFAEYLDAHQDGALEHQEPAGFGVIGAGMYPRPVSGTQHIDLVTTFRDRNVVDDPAALAILSAIVPSAIVEARVQLYNAQIQLRSLQLVEKKIKEIAKAKDPEE